MSIEIIAQSSLFEGLPSRYLEEIKNIGIEKSYRKDENIFLEGDEGNGFYLVITGKVKIFKLSADGKEKILHVLNPKEPFGEVAVFSGKDFPANAICLESSLLMFFPRTDFVRLISENPTLSLNMMSILSQRLKQFAVQIEGLTLKDVPGRLAVYLLDLVVQQENREKVVLTITKGQLASLLGTIPETLSRILARMNTSGLIEVKGRDIEILNLNGLECLAETGRFLEE